MKSFISKRIYFFVLLGTFLSALGPSVFMEYLLKRGKMDREMAIAYFLLFGGFSLLFMFHLIDKFNQNNQKLVINSREKIKIFWCGVFIAAQFFFFTVSMQLGSVTETTMMVRISPIMAILMGHFYLNEKIKNMWRFIIASALCFGGISFMQKNDFTALEFNSVIAIICAIASAFALAAKNTINSSLTSKHHKLPSIITVAWPMIISGFIMSLFSVWHGFIPNGYQFFVLIFLGIFTIGIPGAINAFAFKVTQNMGAVTYFSFLLPLFGAICAYFVVGERGFDYFKIALSLIVISFGVYLINKKTNEGDKS